MLEKLGDPYTRIVGASQSSAFQTDTTGELAGALLVAGVMEGSAAERAGVAVGDELLAINGCEAAALPEEEAAALLQHDAELVLLRTGVRAVLGAQHMRLAALPVQVYPVHYATLPGDDGRMLGYISIQSFGSSTAADTRAALAVLEARGAAGYVMDLRNNGGGLVSAGMGIAELFLPHDSVFCYVVDREAAGEAPVTLEAAHAITSAPLVILVNGETASTSEMLTGALHAAGRAVTAGAHTFGKGRTQRVLPMRDGSTLLVSASLVTTPAHERIDKVGLEPDMACPANAGPPAAMTPAGRSERALVAGLREDACMRVAVRALASQA
ncbi:hypothetical protein WJX81_006983 [Elliptochloris bilobata]|uniref:PDZ domain-containing protein n=1 Tax=Elliptochloris bilobata TaxID=381761 RepID=A0AAW1RU76_9CHLO